jgi:hypothetical protein
MITVLAEAIAAATAPRPCSRPPSTRRAPRGGRRPSVCDCPSPQPGRGPQCLFSAAGIRPARKPIEGKLPPVSHHANSTQCEVLPCASPISQVRGLGSIRLLIGACCAPGRHECPRAHVLVCASAGSPSQTPAGNGTMSSPFPDRRSSFVRARVRSLVAAVLLRVGRQVPASLWR